MKRACPTLTQKPSARIAPRSRVLQAELLEHASRPGVVGGETLVSAVEVVARAALPGHVGEVGAVVHAEVRERHEVLLVDRVPHAELGGDASVEVLRRTSRPSARSGVRGQAEELARLQRVRAAPGRTAPRRGGTRRRSRRRSARDRSTRARTRCRLWIDAKTCSNASGRLAADPELAEAGVAQGVRNVARLCVEDLLAVGDEEQPVSRQACGAGARSRLRP